MMIIILLLTICLNIQAISDFSTFKTKIYVDQIPNNTECYIGADIGGTNSRIGFFSIDKENQNNKPQLLMSFHAKTQDIGDFTELLKKILEYAQEQYGITVKNACIAAPGVTTEKKDFSPVHGIFDIKSKKLIKKCGLEKAIIVNDLSVVGYGIDLIDPNDIVKIYGNEPKEKEMRYIIGGGTGVGSSLALWDNAKSMYITKPGEAGLLEFAPHNKEEYDIVNHIKQMHDSQAVFWAAIPSCSGVRRVYSILKLQGKYKDSLQLDVHNPKVIFSHPEDELCKATIDLCIKTLGRFTRQVSFMILPYGGLFLTGGLIANNAEYLAKELPKAHADTTSNLQKYLMEIPVYIINSKEIGMYGSVKQLLLEIEEKQQS